MSVVLLSRVLRLVIALAVIPVALISVAACKPCPSMITAWADLRQDDGGGYGPLAKGGPKKGGKNEGNGGVNGRGSGSGSTAAKPCPDFGKTGGKKSDSKKDSSMFGANGPTMQSKNLIQDQHVGRYTYRIDVENPNPGKRKGNIHVQLGGQGSTHYYWYPGNRFYTKDGDPLPKRVQEHINESTKARNAIDRGLDLLKEK